MSTKRAQYITVEKYLADEEVAPIRHEYVNGRIFVMSGATRRHNIIAGNIHSIIRAHVRGSRCRAYVSEVKVNVQATNSFYYPDVMVSCDNYGRKSVYTDRPVLLVEVLSRSTASVDRREKVSAYRQIPSLREYLIVNQLKRRAELHRRNEEGDWEILEFDENAEIVLESIPVGPLAISFDQIYEDVDLSGDETQIVSEDTEDSIELEEFYDNDLVPDW